MVSFKFKFKSFNISFNICSRIERNLLSRSPLASSNSSNI